MFQNRLHRRTGVILIILFSVMVEATLQSDLGTINLAHSLHPQLTPGASPIGPDAVQAAQTPLVSWNPAVSCTPVLTTIEGVLGNLYDKNTGGALYVGGGFKPGIPNKRALSPPCFAGSPPNATFVEIHAVQRDDTSLVHDECSTQYDAVNGGGPYPNGKDCDRTGNIHDPNGPIISGVVCSTCMGAIHVEIDQDWNASGVAPPEINLNSTSQLIDVQGFVYWDPDHTDQDFHSYSGWELHPLTAWRLSGASPDFSVSSSPSTIGPVNAGSTITSTITVKSLNGFVGTVSLSELVSPGTGLACSLSPTSANLGTSFTSTLSCTASNAGTYTVTVTGINGALSHPVIVTVKVVDFSMATPPGLSFVAGSSGATIISLGSLNNFAGTVAQTTSTSPGGLTTSLGSFSVSLTAGGTATSALTISSTSSTAAGTYAVTITGTSGSLVHKASFPVNVTSDFAISVNPSSLSFAAGSSATANLGLASLGFSGTISLSATVSPSVPGLTTSLSSSSIALSAGQTSTSILTISSSSSTAAGTYTVIITGNNGSLAHTVSLRANIVDFSVTANPTSITLNAGSTGASTITVTAINGLTGTVSLTQSVTPSGGPTCSLSPAIITAGISTNAVLACNGLSVGSFSVTITAASGSLSHSATVTVNVADFSIATSPTTVSTNTGASATSTITATSLNGFTGTVSLTAATVPSAGLSCSLSQPSIFLGSSGTSLLSCGSSTGTYNVTVTATSSSLTHTTSIIVIVQDFTLAAGPASLSVVSGGNSAITVASINGFTGTVALAASVSPSSGLACTLSSTSIVLGTSATSTLSCAGVAGAYAVTLTGTSGVLSHQTTVLFTIQDFTINANPATVTVQAGTLASSTITLTSLDGLTGTFILTESVSPSPGLSCSLSPTSTTLGSSASSTLSCTGPAGSYTVNVVASGSGLTHIATVTVKVQDFTITATPASVNVLAGATANSTISLAGLGGFAGVVSISSSTFPGNGLTCNLSPASITLGPSGTTTLACAGSPGTYIVTVTGLSGALSHSVTVTFTVQDFTLTAAPTAMVFISGGSGLSNITVGALNGFAGAVSLSVAIIPASGLSCSLSSTSLVLPPSPASSTLSCTGSTGSYTVTVTGKSRGSSRTATATFAIQDFAVSANPTSITIDLGTVGNSTITVTSINGFTSTVSLSASVPSGLSCVLTPSTVSLGSSGTSTLSCNGSPGTYSATLSGSGSGLSHSVSVSFSIQDFMVTASPTSVSVESGANAVSTITVASIAGFTGTVSLSSLVTPSTGLACSLASTTLTISTSATTTVSCNGSAGTYSITVTAATGSLSHSAPVTFTVQDLALTASPSNVTIITGATGTSTLIITSVNGLSGIVSLTSSTSPSTGLTCTLSPSTLTLGSSSSSALSCTGSPGTYNVMVTASTGSLSHQALVTIAVQDFVINASPTAVGINTGDNGSSTIIVSGVNGFADVVTLTETASPDGLSCTLSQTAVSPIVSGNSSLSCNGPPGTYTVTVTGSSHSVSHSVKITLTVQDFTITVAPALVTLNKGDTGTSTVSLNSVGGFANPVSLSLAASGPGLACTLTSLSLTPPGTTSLSCNGNTGSYTVTVTGLGGSLSHSTTVTFTVQDFTLAVNPGTATFHQGDTGASTVTVTGQNGFTGAVTITASVSPGFGLTCSLAPTSVTLGTSATSALSCSGSLGGYTVTVTAASSRLSHSASVEFVAQDFALTASPANVILNAGSAGNTTINAVSANGFTGTVSLSSAISPSAGLSCSLGPASFSLSTSQSSTLSCNGSSGTYTVTVTGASGGTSHSVAVIFTIQDFTVLASPATLTVDSGVTANSTVSIAGVDGFTGTIALTQTVSSSSGFSCSLTAASVTLGPSASLNLSCTGSPGNYKVTVAGSGPAGLSHSATVSVTVQDFSISANPSTVTVNGPATGTSTITLTSLNGFSGSVALTSGVSPSGGLTCSLSQTSVSLSSSANSILSCSGRPGVYNVTVTGTSLPLLHAAAVVYTVQDFATSADPTSVTANAGSTGTSTIVVSALDGFTGTVSLTSTISPRHGLACTLTPTSIILGISGTSSLSCSGSAGTYSVTVSATSGSLAHSIAVSFLVQNITGPDFTMTANPTNVTTTPGATATSSISVNSVNGFSGNISLTQSVSPAIGFACSLNPTGFNLTGSASSTLSCNGSPGIYSVTVTGSNGTLVHTVSVAFSVEDFSLAASPADAVANAGSPAVSTITLGSQGGFTGTVALVASASPSGGVACSFSASGVMLGNSGTSTVACEGTAGTYSVTITGSSGSLSHSATVTVRIQDFTISLDKVTATILTGASSTATLTLNSVNSFGGSVSITETVAPVPGLSCSPSQTTVSLAGSANVAISCNSSSSGQFTVVVTTASGSLSHTASISFTVQDFVLTTSGPIGVTCHASDSCNVPVELVPLNGFTGPVTLLPSASPGLTATLSPSSLAGTGLSILTVSAATPANYTVIVTGTSGSLSRSTAVITVRVVDFTISASSETVTSTAGTNATIGITVTPSNRFTGTVTLSESWSPSTGLDCSLNPNSIYAAGTLLLSCNGQAGVYSLSVTGSSGSLSHSISVSLTIADYTLTAAKNAITVTAGTAGSSSITVAPVNGFTGVVSLSASASPPNGLRCSITPGTITLGAAATATLSCNGFAGNYIVTVTGNSMGLARSSVLSFSVSDFAVVANPSSAVVITGTQATSVITVSSLAGFTGTASLSLGSSSAGITCSLSVPSVSLGSSGSSNLSCSGASGTYAVTVTATSGSLSHMVTVNFAFQDFSLFASPSSLTTTGGSTGSLPITLVSLQGFTGTVTLAALFQPGLTCALAPTSVALASSATSTLSCTGSPGTYSITVTGTSAPLSHSAKIVLTIQDFSLAASPNSETLIPGVARTSTITVSSLNGFTGIILLSDSISPSTGLSCQLGPSSLTLSSSANSTLSCSGSPGTYSVTVTGSRGSLSRSTTITFMVQDFTITANPGSITVFSATAATSTLSLTGQGGFSGVLNLSATVSPSAGLACSFTPASISLGTTATSTLSCTGSPGTYIVTIIARGALASHSATVTFTIQDFSLAASVAGLSIDAGATGASTITASPVNGFSGAVTLSSSISPSNGLTCTLSPSTVSLGTAARSVLSCSGSAGTYTVTVTGSSSGLSHSITVLYTLHDFNLNASPTSPAALAGGTGNSTITVTAVNGFEGRVNLSTIVSPASGLICSFSAISLSLSSSPAPSVISCTGSPGSYAVTVTGTDNTVSHSTTLTFTVQDFTISANPASVASKVGTQGASTITASPLSGLGATLSLGFTVTPATGLTCTLSASTITLGPPGTSSLSCNATAAGVYTLTVTASSGSLSHSTIIDFTVQDFAVGASSSSITSTAGAAGTSSITATSVDGFAGTLSLVLSVSPTSGLVCTLNPGTVTLGTSAASTISCSGSAGTYTVTITASSGTLAHSISVGFSVQDFTLTANPTTVTIPAGSPGTSTITMTSIGGFAGTLSLSSKSAVGLSCSLSPSSVSLAAQTTSTLSCSGSAGVYTVNATVSSTGISHNTLVTFRVQDFSLNATPTLVAVAAGSTGISTLTATSLNGFAGTLGLSQSVYPLGLACTLSTTSITLGGSATSTLSCNGAAGTYTVTVAGIGGSVSHSVPVKFIVADFGMSSSPVVSFLAGSSGTTIISLNSLGFAGTVGLTLSPPSITGLAASLSPTSITLTTGASGTSTLVISTTGATRAGSYNLNITGTSGPVVHTLTIIFTVLNDFTVSPSATSVSLVAGSSRGLSVSLRSLGFSGTLLLATSVSGGGATASLSPVSVALTPGAVVNSTLTVSSSTAGTYTVTVTGTAGGVSHSTIISLKVVDFSISVGPASLTLQAAYSGSSTASLTGLNSFSGTVVLTISLTSSSPAVSANPLAITFVSGGMGTSALTVLTTSATIPGDYTITITGTSGGLSHSASLFVTVRGFNIAITPSQLTVPVGSSASTTIQLTSLNGFSGTVTLSSSSTPSGPAISLSPNSISLASGASGSSTLTVSLPSTLPPGDYFIIVNATSGLELRQASAIIFVVDFSISASPSTLTIQAGNSATSTVKLTSLNGFAGSLSLSGSASPVVANGPTTSFNPAVVAVLAARSATSTLALSTTSFTPAGTYGITVTATNGTLVRSVSLILVVTGNFAIASTPASLGLPAGSSTTSTITLNSTGFSGTVSLSATSSPPGPTFSFSPGVLTLSFGGSGTSTLKITTLASTASGRYNVTVTGTSSPLVRYTLLTVTVQSNFTVSATSTVPGSFDAGGSTSAKIFLNSTGFTGLVSLALRVSPLGPIASLNPSSVSLTPGGSVVSTLSLATTTSTLSGSYTVTVTGTSGSMNRQATLTITVTGNFTITSSSTILTISAGSVGSSRILISSAGLTGTLTLNVTRPSSSLATSINPATVSLVAGGSAGSNLTITTIPSTLAGTYSVTVSGTSGSLSHSITITVNVTGDFTISATLTGPGGFVATGSTTSTITVSSFGLLGNVSLSATVSPSLPGGPTTTFGTPTLQVTPGSAASSTLTGSTTASTPAGNYTITITGLAAGLSHSSNFNITIQADFTLTTTSGTMVVPAGTSGSSTITLSSLGLSGPIALSATVTPTGPSLALNPSTVQLSVGGAGASTLSFATGRVGNYTVIVIASIGSLSHTTSVIVRVVDFAIAVDPATVIVNVGSSGLSTVTLTSLNGFSGTITLTSVLSSSIPICNLNPTGLVLGSSVSSILTCSGFTTGFSANLTASSGPLSHSATVTFIAQDFTIAASPAGLTVDAGVNGTSTITVASVNNYVGTVTLSESASPAGIVCRLAASSLFLGTTATTILYCNGSAGTYTVTVTGSSSSLAHSVVVTVRVQDFSITASPPTVSVIAGVTGSSTVVISSVNGLTGTTNLAFTISPTIGLTCNLVPMSLGLAASANSSLSCSGSTGVYTVTVTASVGSLVHSIALQFTVKDFAIAAAPLSLTVSALATGSSVVSVTSLNGLTGNVSLTFSITPNEGLSCNLNPSRLTVGPSSSSLLSCNGSSGTYVVSIAGATATLSHTVSVVFIVQDFTVSAAPPSISINALNTGTSMVNIYALNGFSGTVTLSTNVTPGLTATLAANTIIASGSSTLTVTAGSPGAYTATVTANSGSLVHSVAISVIVADFTVSASPVSLRFDAGVSATSGITTTAVNGFNDTITLSASSSAGLAASISQLSVSGSGSAILTVTAAAAGTYTVTVTAASGQISHATPAIMVTVVDFNIAASPSTAGPVNVGSSGTTTITVTAVNGFSDTVSLTVNSTVGVTANLSSSSLTSGSLILTVSAASAGSYGVTVTGTSGPLIHTTFINVNVVDFTVSANPLSLRLTAGAIGTSTITVSPLNGFAGTVVLSTTASSGLDATLGALSISGSGESVLTLKAASEGTFNVTVTAKIGSLSHSTRPITVTVVDFTIAASPSSIILDAGMTGTSTVTVTSLNGFNDTVALRVFSSPGLNVSIAPVSVTSAGTSTLTVSAVVAGTYNVTVTGSSGSLNHQTVTITITVIDFIIRGSPSTITVDAGAQGTFAVTISSTNGFGRTVLLSAAGSSGLTATINPASVTAPGTATLAVSAGVAGTFTVTVTGSSGSLVHTATLTVNVVDFAVIASPTSITLYAHSLGTSTITISSVNGFSGTVTLSTTTSPGIAGALSVQTIVGSGTSTVTMNATVAGTYNITVTGVSGPLSHNAPTITVNVVDFTISASPVNLTIDAGSSGASTLAIAALNGFSGIVALTSSYSLGLNVALSPTAVTGSGASTVTVSAAAAGTYTLSITGSSGPLLHRTGTIIVNVVDFALTASPTSLTLDSGTSGASSITVSALNGFSGIVSFSVNASQGLAVHFSPNSITGSGTSTVTMGASMAGTYTLTVTGSSGLLAHTTGSLTVNVVDFSIASTPSSLTLYAGTSGTSAITITSQNSFSGTVYLTETNPPGLTASLTQVIITGAGSSTLTVSASTPGTYTATVTGTSGSLIHITAVTVNVVDFSLAADPSAVTLNNGASSTSSMTVASINGFSGTVLLTPRSPTGLATSLEPTSVTGAGTSVLTLNATSPGTYTVTVTGTSGPLSHSMVLTVRVVDFSVSISQSSVILFVGSQSSLTVTVGPVNGFTGTVVLSDNPSNGLTATLNTLSVTGSGNSTLTLSAITVGNYTVTVSASSGSLSHTTSPIIVRIVDFVLAASPATFTIDAGATGAANVTVSSLNGFSGGIGFTASTSVGLTASLSLSSVTGSGHLTISVTAPSAGTYTAKVTGVSGPLMHSVLVTVRVVDFAIASSPSTIIFVKGSSSSSIVSVTSLNGFSGPVTLRAEPSSNAINVSLTPTRLSGGGTSTLLVAGQIEGSFNIIVTAGSGGLTHSTVLVVIVSPRPDFIVSASPPTVGPLKVGVLGASTVAVTPINGFIGIVRLTADSSQGVASSINPTSVTLGAVGLSTLRMSSSAAGTYTVTVTATNGTLTRSVTVTVSVVDFIITANPSTLTLDAGSSANSTLTIAGLNGFADTVALTTSSSGSIDLTASSYGPRTFLTPTSITLTAGATGTAVLTVESGTVGPGPYALTLTGRSGGLTHSITVNVRVVDFSIESLRASVSVPVGSSVNSSLTLTSLGGFAGSLTLNLTTTSVGVEGNLTSSGLTLLAGEQASTMMTVSIAKGTALGIYKITVRAFSGSLLRSLDVSVSVTDFVIHASRSSLTLSPGTSTSLTINLDGVKGFMGTIGLTALVSPAGPDASLTQDTANVPAGGSNSTSLAVSAGPSAAWGVYKVNVTAVIGGLSHSVTISLRIGPVPVLSVPGPQSIPAGSSLFFVVNATDQDRGKTITIRAEGLPAGATFYSIQGYGATSGLFSWTPLKGQSPGSYNITFKVDDGQGLTTSAQVTIQVSSASNVSYLPSLPLLQTILAGFFMVAMAGLLYAVRKMNRSMKAQRLNSSCMTRTEKFPVKTPSPML